MSKVLKYFDIVKLIHPDWNPEIKDPEIKMEVVTKYKDDQEKLYKFAVQWGLIEDNTIKSFEVLYSLEPGKKIKINQNIEGIIVDIKKNSFKTDVIVCVNKEFKKYIRNNEELQDNDFYAIGYADSNEYMKVDFKYQTNFNFNINIREKKKT